MLGGSGKVRRDAAAAAAAAQERDKWRGIMPICNNAAAGTPIIPAAFHPPVESLAVTKEEG